jgi:hypothetical protein
VYITAKVTLKFDSDTWLFTSGTEILKAAHLRFLSSSLGITRPDYQRNADIGINVSNIVSETEGG